MPEINSVDAVREKLREFDDQMNEAISAARSLAKIRADAGKMQDDLINLTSATQGEVQQLSGIKAALKNARNEWLSLIKDLTQSLAESIDARAKLENSRSSALRSIDTKLAQAEDRVLSASRVSFANQEHVLARLEAGTRTNAELAAKAAGSAGKHADQLQELLQSLRTDLQRDSANEALRIEQLLGSKFKKLQGDFEATAQSNFQLLEAAAASNDKFLHEEASALRDEQQLFRSKMEDFVGAAVESMAQRFSNFSRDSNGEMASFKDEVAASLREEHESMSRQVTDFLNKQNALVQNLSQQIDAFQRAASVNSATLREVQLKMSDLSIALRRCQETAADQFEKSRNEVSEMRRSTNEIQVGLQEEARARRLQEGIVQGLGSLLEETLKKLKNLPFVGKTFS